MEIKYTDDKKEKYQSVRAELTLSLTRSMGHTDLYVEGLGATEEEAKRELLMLLHCVIREATHIAETETPTNRPTHPQDK